MNVFSFSTPCLQNYLIGYTISQNGAPSFISPYFRRFLTITCDWTRDDSAFGPGGLDGQGEFISGTITQTYGSPTTTATGQIYGGNTTPNCVIPFYFPYYGQLLPTGDPDNQWTVTDNTATSVIRYYYPPLTAARVVTTTVTLSNEYTLGQLESDGDSQMAAELAAYPFTPAWGSITSFGFGEEPTPDIVTSLADFVPAPGEFIAAWSGMGYAGIGAGGTYYPNAFTKFIGYVMMAGLYRERTHLIDFDSNHQNPTDGGIKCSNGSGACGTTFEVIPPGPSPTQNAFVTITPNCQCP